MKINKAVTEAVINYIHLTFEKENLGLGELKVVLISSGIPKQEVAEFIKKKKCKHGIDYQKIEEEMASNEQFFLSLSANLLSYLKKEQKDMLQQIMRKFGYILGVNKQFRKGKKLELVDYDKGRTVKKIEIYRDKERGRYRVSVNDKLLNWIIPRGLADKPYWQYLYEIAQEGESYIDDAEKAKGLQQWANSRKDNIIYKHTGLKSTKIIEYRSDSFYPASGIIIKELSQKKAYPE